MRRWVGRARRQRWMIVTVAVVLLVGLAGCMQYHGPLTNLGEVDQYPPARWYPQPALSRVALNAGIYMMPSQHLILVHVQIPDTSVTSLGPGAVRGAVGVWWVALDDRVPANEGTLVWVASCGLFKTTQMDAAYDLVGGYLTGPARTSLSRYPLEFNPDDDSVSVALSPQDIITVPRESTGSASAAMRPANVVCSAHA